MDSGILSLITFTLLLVLLFFTDIDLPFYVIPLQRTWSSRFPIHTSKPNIRNAPKVVPSEIPSNDSERSVDSTVTKGQHNPKPSIKIQIPSSNKHQPLICRPSTRAIFYPPRSKGPVDDHWGTHTWCPTIFKANNKEYVLYENGTIYMRDNWGQLHSAAEMPPSIGGTCRIPGENFELSLDKQGYICLKEDNSPIAQRLDTWCLDNDPELSGTPRLVPGRGCFSYRVGDCPSPSPLNNTMFGLGCSGPIPPQVIYVASAFGNETIQPFASGSGTSNNTLPYPLTPSPTTNSSSSPGTESHGSSPNTSPEYIAIHGQSSIERRTCPHCSKVLRRPGALRIHIYTHTGHKPCKCHSCGYASTNETNLRRHIQTMHKGA